MGSGSPCIRDLAKLYEWIDYWYDPEKLIDDGTILAKVRLRHPM